jgi:regulator of sigma E protease
VETTWRMSALTLKMLVKMLKLEVSTKTISGPLTIAQYAGASAQVGLDRFFMFLAVVSISLGVLNLLPIPVLDGGHLLIYLIEAIQGRPLSERVLHWGQQIGVALLFALMALAFYNDFMRLLY